MKEDNPQFYIIYRCEQKQAKPTQEATLSPYSIRSKKLERIYKDKQDVEHNLPQILPELTQQCSKHHKDTPIAIYHETCTEKEYKEWKLKRQHT